MNSNEDVSGLGRLTQSVNITFQRYKIHKPWCVIPHGKSAKFIDAFVNLHLQKAIFP